MGKQLLVPRNSAAAPRAPHAAHVVTRLVPDPLRPGHTIARKFVMRSPIAKALDKRPPLPKPERQPIVEHGVGENLELQRRADEKLEDLRTKALRKLYSLKQTAMLLKTHAKVLVRQCHPLCALVTDCPTNPTCVELGLLGAYEAGKADAAFPAVRALLKELRNAAADRFLSGAGAASATPPPAAHKAPPRASSSPSSITAAF